MNGFIDQLRNTYITNSRFIGEKHRKYKISNEILFL